MSSETRIVLTTGDPAGIGPEIIAKAFIKEPRTMRGCAVVGALEVVRHGLQIACPSEVPMTACSINSYADIPSLQAGCIPVLAPLPSPSHYSLGRVSADSGRYAGECVLLASQLALTGDVDAVVTAPLNKAALALAGEMFTGFPGHTELLQSEAARSIGKTTAQLPVRMMLANNELRVVLVSIHMSLRNAIAAVTIPNVLETIRVTDRALASVFGRRPRIAVAGLNPHAGEGGLFGDEEAGAIAPAIDAARALGINATGPFAPDTVFGRARQGLGRPEEFDVVVAMYHDQGLIPVKYLGIDDGVNVTLGLPYVRTSPDHGTAFDIAGKGLANPSSLLAAVRMARSLVERSR